MKQFAVPLLTFALGFAVCWLIRDQQPHGDTATPVIDPTRDIRITRVHTTKHFAQILHPFHVVADQKQTRIGTVPPEGEPYWVISFNGGTVIIHATQEHGD